MSMSTMDGTTTSRFKTFSSYKAERADDGKAKKAMAKTVERSFKDRQAMLKKQAKEEERAAKTADKEAERGRKAEVAEIIKNAKSTAKDQLSLIQSVASISSMLDPDTANFVGMVASQIGRLAQARLITRNHLAAAAVINHSFVQARMGDPKISAAVAKVSRGATP